MNKKVGVGPNHVLAKDGSVLFSKLIMFPRRRLALPLEFINRILVRHHQRKIGLSSILNSSFSIRRILVGGDLGCY